ncbi:hypothetical protein SI65_02760 [Aspergillus cristatus]|uniref:FAD-binding domain-containing protein n=1 Tax=Aspergillus cristatus TaxID=573508 RepID=A0A1E3BNH1_ASPCR|nr:hypothetical protein SI65_02760 [Aspergillus cristatus]
MSLQLAIIGSGLAGLAAARILREHHEVTVYERGGPDAATGGQGICLFSNGIKILQTMGFDRDRAGAVPCHGYRTFDKDGKLVKDFPVDFKGKYGADTMAMKRSDFRDELLRLATAPSESWPDEGLVVFKDSSTIQADVVIVADGVHSRLRHRIVDSSYQPKKNGMTCYRVAISAEAVKAALGYLPESWDPRTADSRISTLMAGDGSRRTVTAYPLRNYDYMSFSCLFPGRQDRGNVLESWYADGDRQEMVDTFNDFSYPLRKILDIATEVKVWELQDLDPLPRWNKGRTILIGDAAHAMTPMQGQGSNMAVEDADSFRLLRPGLTREEVEGVLKQVDSIRRPRTARVLGDTRAMAKGISMDEMIANLDFNCGYNGVFEALKRME